MVHHAARDPHDDGTILGPVFVKKISSQKLPVSNKITPKSGKMNLKGKTFCTGLIHRHFLHLGCLFLMKGILS